MISNPATSAVNLITSAQIKAADAAHSIATFPVEKDEVGSTNFNSSDLFRPIISLKEAEIETSAAVKVLEADNKMKGSLFDAIA
jgi:hypothetical protein